MTYDDFDIRQILGQLSPQMGTYYSPDGRYNVGAWIDPADYQNAANYRTEGNAADSMSTSYEGPWRYRVTQHLGGTSGGYGGGGSAAYNGVGYDEYDSSGNFLNSGQWSDLGISGLDKFMAYLPLLGAGAGMALAGFGGAAGAGAAGAGESAMAGMDALYGGFGSEALGGTMSVGGAGAGGLTSVMGAGGGGESAMAGMDSLYGGFGTETMGTMSPAQFASSNPSLWQSLTSKLGNSGATELVKNMASSGGSNWLGLASTLLGGLAGAQGQDASQSTSRQLPGFLQGPVGGDLVPRTQGLLGSTLPQAQQAGQQMLSVGSGLLGQTQPTHSPWLGQQADDIQRRTKEMLDQNNMSIASRAAGSAGVGGSRMGVQQGIAAGKAADYLQGNLANLYGNAWNQDANRLLQQQTLGAGIMSQGIDTQYAPLKNTANVYSPFTGFGQTTSSAESGGGWGGGIGGAISGAAMAGKLGWWD